MPHETTFTYPGGWQPIRYPERCRQRHALLTDALNDAIDVCRRQSTVLALFVFGSYARADVSPWSDLDLAVVVDGNPAAVVRALYARGALGDVVGIEGPDWESRLARNPFGETIAREHVVAYARSTR